ncbi:hypothetical protein [Lutibacter sp.]|uniref:hypothetical protein n=1 Tax=Lutibacter sp. TaxID=1925666 RepID=UPI0034A0AE4B
MAVKVYQLSAKKFYSTLGFTKRKEFWQEYKKLKNKYDFIKFNLFTSTIIFREVFKILLTNPRIKEDFKGFGSMMFECNEIKRIMLKDNKIDELRKNKNFRLKNRAITLKSKFDYVEICLDNYYISDISRIISRYLIMECGFVNKCEYYNKICSSCFYPVINNNFDDIKTGVICNRCRNERDRERAEECEKINRQYWQEYREKVGYSISKSNQYRDRSKDLDDSDSE